MSDQNTASNPAELDRRAFVSRNLSAGLAAATLLTGPTRAIVGQSQTASPDRETKNSALPVRAFGKIGRQIPILAFGGSAMVEKWKGGYGPQLSFEGRVAMIRHAFESGIRYFDTSPNYGESESLLGEALHDVRDQVYLATKVGVPRSDNAILKPEEVRASLKNPSKCSEPIVLTACRSMGRSSSAWAFRGRSRFTMSWSSSVLRSCSVTLD